MSSPLVSAIIAVHNGDRYIREAIDSVRAQSYQPIEIIVIDDGSTDSTVEVCRAVGPDVQVIQQANQGAGAARNLGVERATGEFIALLDHDDVWLPDKIARQLAAFEDNIQTGVCFTHVVEFAEGLEDSVPKPGLISSTLMMRRRLYLELGGFETERFAGEMIRLMTMAIDQGCTQVILPEVLVKRRLHEGHKSIDRTRYQQYVGAVRDVLQRRRNGASNL